MKFTKIAIVTILQAAQAVSANNVVYEAPAGGDVQFSCDTDGDTCCSNSSWGGITDTGVSVWGRSVGCAHSSTQATLKDCQVASGCILECSSGCTVDGATPLSTVTASTAAAMETTTTSTVAAATAAAMEATTTEAATTAATAGAQAPPASADATADGFTAIGGDFSTVSSVMISPSCPFETMTSYANSVYTIQPSTEAFVSSYPANLVTTTVSGGELSFALNPAVAEGATSGGIRIGLPADQFQKLSVGAAQTVQIVDGFTSLQSIEASGASTLTATLTSSAELALNVQGASTVDIVSNMIKSVVAEGSSTVSVQASVTDSITVEGASTVGIDGSVASGSVSGASTVDITGDISGALDNSGASTLSAGTISGSVSNTGVGTVNAASCDNVQNSFPSSCNVSGPPTVTVDVSSVGEISTGTSKCSNGGFFSGGSTITFSDGGSSASAITAAGAGVATLVAFLLV